MRNPELRPLYGKSLRGGLLLYGPPGCGKTFLARAIAGELGAQFFTSSGSHDVLDMWLGQSERNLHELFERRPRDAPCVLFLDEVDALGQKRSLNRSSAMRTTWSTSCSTELDGVDGGQRGRLRARRDQPAVGRRPRAAPAGPARPHPARAAAGRARARGDPAAPPARPAGRGHRPRRGWPRRPRGSPAPTSRTCARRRRSSRSRRPSVTVRPDRSAPRISRARSSAQRPSTRPWFEMARNFVLFSNSSGEFDPLADYMKRHRLL